MIGAAWRAFFDALGEHQRVTVGVEATKYDGWVDSLGIAEVEGRDADHIVIVDHHGVSMWIPLGKITAVEVEW